MLGPDLVIFSLAIDIIELCEWVVIINNTSQLIIDEYSFRNLRAYCGALYCAAHFHTSSLSSQLLVTEQDADQFILNHGANTHIASF